jgi:hypothetical protein
MHRRAFFVLSTPARKKGTSLGETNSRDWKLGVFPVRAFLADEALPARDAPLGDTQAAVRRLRPLDESFDLRFKGFSMRCGIAPSCTAARAQFCNCEKNTVKIGRLDAPFAELVFHSSNLTAFDCPKDRRPVQSNRFCSRCETIGHDTYPCVEQDTLMVSLGPRALRRNRAGFRRHQE